MLMEIDNFHGTSLKTCLCAKSYVCLLGSHMMYMHSLIVELSTLMNPMLCGPPRVTHFRDYYVGPHSSIYTIIVLSPTWCRRAV